MQAVPINSALCSRGCLNPKVSVVIPNYNYAEFLRDCVFSVLDQTYKNIEIVIVDNGSTDYSRSVIGELVVSYPTKIRAFFQENKGQAGSRNRGILESRGEIVAFLDADDKWLPSKLEEQLSLLQSDQTLGLVYCGFYKVDEKMNILERVTPKYTGDILTQFALAGGDPVVVGGESSAIFYRDLAELVGYLDLSLEESSGWDFFRKLASVTKVGAVSSGLMLYRQHDKSHSVSSKKMYHQMLLHIAKIFEDDRSIRVWSLAPKAYSIVYIDYALSSLRRFKWCDALFYFARAFASHPLSSISRLRLKFSRKVGVRGV